MNSVHCGHGGKLVPWELQPRGRKGLIFPCFQKPPLLFSREVGALEPHWTGSEKRPGRCHFVAM